MNPEYARIFENYTFEIHSHKLMPDVTVEVVVKTNVGNYSAQFYHLDEEAKESFNAIYATDGIEIMDLTQSRIRKTIDDMIESKSFFKFFHKEEKKEKN